MVDNNKCWLKDSCDHSDCDKLCMRHFKLNYLYNYAYVPLEKRKRQALRIDADGTDGEEFTQLSNIEKHIVDFVKNGKNLFLHSGQSGNGKTSWEYRFIQSYFNAIWEKSGLRCRAIFINVPRFLLSLKENISQKSEYVQDIKENIETADLVIWDDIGTKMITPYEAEHLLAYINMRLDGEKSNIFTSNLSDVEMHQFLGDRLYSRIIGSTYNIELHGKDKRGHKDDSCN